jgi:hypothetical protein
MSERVNVHVSFSTLPKGRGIHIEVECELVAVDHVSGIDGEELNAIMSHGFFSEDAVKLHLLPRSIKRSI